MSNTFINKSEGSTEPEQFLVCEPQPHYIADDYQHLFNSVPVGIYRSTPDGRLLLANTYFKKMLGIESAKSMIDLNWLSNKLSYSRREFIDQIHRDGFIEDYFGEYRKEDNNVLYYLESAQAFLDESGNIKFFEGIVTDITNFKQVQDALYESEEKYRLLFEKSGDPILLIDGDKWADCNDAAVKFFGLNHKNELIGSTPYDNSPSRQEGNESSKEKAVELIRYAFENGFNRFEWVHLTANGEEKHVDVMLTAIPFKKKMLLFTLLRDISSRKKAELELKISEEKFRSIFEQSLDGIVLTSEEGVIIDSNPATAHITGYIIDDIIASNFWDFTNKITEVNTNKIQNFSDFKTFYESFLPENGFNKQSRKAEACIIRKDGSKAYIHYNSFLVNTAFGKMICSIVRDMTEIQIVSEEIKAQKELFETLLKTSPIAILLINFQGDILFASQRIYDFFKLHGREVPEKLNVKSMTRSNNGAELESAIKTVIEKGTLTNFEIDIKPFEGKIFRADINASIIKEKSGKPEAIIATIMDISQRKQAESIREQAIAATFEALEKKHEAVELLDNSARLASIGVIAGGIIHEIAQPLNAIRIGSEGIISWDLNNGDILPKPIISMLNGISNASIRIENIVRQMRNIWLESDSVTLESVDLNDAVLSALNLVRMRAQSHEITFDISLATEQLVVSANKVHLELVVNNLVTNSVNSLDKTNKKDKLIKLITYKQNNIVFLVVYDNGCGLPDISEEKLFDPFFSTRQKEGGTGLGLAIVKMFLKKFNAGIQPFNNPEGGATFIVNFNLINSSENDNV